jgi:hypothetical protein
VKESRPQNTFAQFGILLDSLRLTSNEHDLLKMLFSSSYPESPEIAPPDLETEEAPHEMGCAEQGNIARSIDSMASDEECCQFSIGILEEIANIEEVWRFWNRDQ